MPNEILFRLAIELAGLAVAVGVVSAKVTALQREVYYLRRRVDQFLDRQSPVVAPPPS